MGGADRTASEGPVSDNPLLGGLIPLHVLYHAARKEIYGQGMMDELRRHGYRIGPGTLYPMLHRLEARGYLRVREERHGRTLRRYYRATARGKAAVESVTPRVAELYRELVEHRVPRSRSR
jgi:DNA-binding PadR family transcriptional regulator